MSKKTVSQTSRILRVTAFAATLLAISCTLDPVADFIRDNPLDPESSSYQGYPTVDQLSDVEVVWPEDESESAFVPLLTVSELLGATAYDFAIDTNRYDLIGAPDYTAVGLTSGGQPSNTLDLWAEVDASEGLPAGTYYWQAAVTDGSGTTGSALSGGRFTIVDVITDSDVLPVHDDAIADTSPELSWPAITGAGSYEVQTATIAVDLGTGAGTEVTELVTGLSYEWPSASAVELGDSIYWRVRGVDENSREYTHWYGDFTIPVTAWDSISWSPLPSGGGTTTSRFPVIDWSDISDAVTYSIVTGLSAADLNTATPVTVTVSEYTYPYYVGDSDTVWWRVKAQNEDQKESAWSADYSFTYSSDIDIGFFLAAGPEQPDSGENVTVAYYSDSGYWVTIATLTPTDCNNSTGANFSYTLDAVSHSDAFHANFRIKFTQVSSSGSGYDNYYLDNVSIVVGSSGFTDDFSDGSIDSSKWYAWNGVSETGGRLKTDGSSTRYIETVDIPTN